MNLVNDLQNILRTYNGNNNLKRAGEKISFTEDNMREWIRCKSDPIYFINTYCKIISLDDGIVPFKTYEYQDRAIECMHENRNIILMFPRQLGKTTVVAGYILHYVIFSDVVPNVAILANKGSAAREVMQRFQLMYEYLPKWMQKGVKTWNKGNIILEGEQGTDGAQVFTASTSSSGIRGKAVSLLYVDECAIIPNTVAEEFFTSTFPTISSGEKTKIIMSSTPKGYNHFWKFWNDAEQGKNGYVPIRARWDEHPKRTQKWADEQLVLLGKLKFTQEVSCEFLGSSSTLLSSACISNLTALPNVHVTNDGLSVSQLPIPGHNYVITVDPSKGVGRDYSVFSIIDTTCLPYKLVGKYKNNSISPMLFPSIIAKLGKEYNSAWVLIETNISEQVPHILYYDIGYENIFTIARGNKGQHLSGGFSNSSKLGIQTDKKTKLLGCNNIKVLIEENKLLVHDSDVISEFSTFVDNGKGSYEADDGYNDDLAMSLVLFGWLTTQQYFKDMGDVDIRNRIYEDRMKVIDEEMLPPGFFWDGQNDDDDFMKL